MIGPESTNYAIQLAQSVERMERLENSINDLANVVNASFKSIKHEQAVMKKEQKNILLNQKKLEKKANSQSNALTNIVATTLCMTLKNSFYYIFNRTKYYENTKHVVSSLQSKAKGC